MTFLLYHYASASKNKFESLQTERYRSSDKHLKEVFPSYIDHISFMFERPPFEKIAELYEKKGYKHPFWYTGHALIEYIVDLDKFHSTKEILYKIVETPEKTKLYYDDNIDIKTYHKMLEQVIKENGYEGTTISELKKAWSKLRSRLHRNWLLESYKALMSSSNFDENKNKYAPTVPHLMFYTAEGVIPYVETNTIRIGGEVSQETFHILKTW